MERRKNPGEKETAEQPGRRGFMEKLRRTVDCLQDTETEQGLADSGTRRSL